MNNKINKPTIFDKPPQSFGTTIVELIKLLAMLFLYLIGIGFFMNMGFWFGHDDNK